MVVTPRQSMPGHAPQSSSGYSCIIISVHLYEVRHLKQKRLSHKTNISYRQMKNQVKYVCEGDNIRCFMVWGFSDKKIMQLLNLRTPQDRRTNLSAGIINLSKL